MKIRVVSGLILAVACGSATTPNYSLDQPAEFAALRYSDTNLESLNGWCSNTGMLLNPDIEPLYVNGSPIGFC